MPAIEVVTKVTANTHVIRIPLATYQQAVEIAFSRHLSVSDIVSLAVNKLCENEKDA
jgi:hypothetical protein